MADFTFTEVNDPKVGRANAVDHKGFRRVRGTLTGPASYDTGGSNLPITSLPINEVFELHVVVDDSAPNHDGNALQFAAGSPGSVTVVDNTGAEVAAAADLSGASWLVEIIGK